LTSYFAKCAVKEEQTIAKTKADPYGMTTKRTKATTTATAIATAKYRDLSTAAAKSAAFGRDDVLS
jgi:hypothetical protein